MLIISDGCSLSFSALQKLFCSHIEACACTQVHKPEDVKRIFSAISKNIFTTRHIKRFSLILLMNLFTERTAKATEIYVGFLQKFVHYLLKHFVSLPNKKAENTKEHVSPYFIHSEHTKVRGVLALTPMTSRQKKCCFRSLNCLEQQD